MSRPKKDKHSQGDARAISTADIPEAIAAIARQAQIDMLRADPHGEDILSATGFSSVMLGRADAMDKITVAEAMLHALKNLSSDELAEFFARIVRMKSNIENPHRTARAYYGYTRFVEENGKEPSKPELKDYLIENSKIFIGMPNRDDGKGWTRLWRESGLSNLSDR